MMNERERILSDPLISEVLAVEAESVGVTLEEYVERFLELYDQDPHRFISILNKNV